MDAYRRGATWDSLPQSAAALPGTTQHCSLTPARQLIAFHSLSPHSIYRAPTMLQGACLQTTDGLMKANDQRFRYEHALYAGERNLMTLGDGEPC